MKEPYKQGVANILTSSLAPGAARCRVKCRQRHRRARDRASKNEFRAPTECLQREGHTGGSDIASFRQARRSPRAVRTSRNCTRENRETSLASGAYPGSGSVREAKSAIRACTPARSRTRAYYLRSCRTRPGKPGGGSGGGKARDQGEHRGI